MYTFSSKLKIFSFILMALGAIAVIYGFLQVPKSAQEVEAMLKDAHAAHGHTAVAHTAHNNAHKEEVAKVLNDSLHNTTTLDSLKANEAIAVKASHDKENELAVEIDNAKKEHEEHVNHVWHQLQNKPWASVYVACIFFMLISLGVLAFYAIQQAAQAGWSPILFRVMEGITSYLLPGSIIFFLLLIFGVMHYHHLFIWMDEKVVEADHLIKAKSGYLNGTFFLIRALIFLLGWNFYRYISRKNALALEKTSDVKYYKNNFKWAAGFLVFFIITESIMSWDWIMSVDPHWYSTLFGWYVFASFFVSGVTTIALITIYLKSRGYLENVNTSHLHDLAKFMFGLSIFWTYLWFSQFMLIWYSNIPEEVTYFVTRIEHYKLPFFGMVVMNFLFPLFILINTDFKRLSWIVVMAGIVNLLGYYLDFYNKIMPATLGESWSIGVSELGALSFFLGLFIFIVFSALTKVPLEPKGNPLIEESKHFHY